MAVFDGVHYVLSSSIPGEQRKELSGLLDLNGATSAPPHSHLIALAGSRTQHEHAGSLHVVSGMWVQRSIVLGKLQLEQYYSPDPTMIFSGIVACATDLSPSDLEVLSAGITSLGGQWRTGLTRDVTHLFALHEQSDKYQTAMHFAPHTHMSVLTPHWFDDSVRVGRRVPEGPYLWPDPKVLQPGMQVTMDDDDLEIGESGKKKRKKSGETRLSSPIPMEEADRRERVNVWAGRRLLLSRSLELGQGHREAVEANIQRAGGIVVKVKGTGTDEEAQEDEEATLVDECDVFVTRYRSGKAYFKAARSSRPILIGNLTWMFHVDASSTLNDPHDSLLWYPVPRGGIPGLNECITVTNYSGAARDYLKKLIQIMGGRFTPSMSQSNKVLVAGYSPSPKTQRAVAWSIPIVNHTWLEDCFIAWKNLTVGVDKYILFPPGVDFGKMLMTPIGEDAEYRRSMIDNVEPVTPSTKTPNTTGKAKTASSKSKPKTIDEIEDGSPPNSSQPVALRPKRTALTAPQATDMSTRDDREVEIAVNFGDDEGPNLDDAGDIAAGVAMDVDDEYVSPSRSLRQQKPKPKSKSSENKLSTTKEKTKHRKARPLPPSREHSDSESALAHPSRPIPGSSTPVKTGMKPKPKPKETPQRASSLSDDDDEIFARPAKHKSTTPSTKAKAKAKEPEKEPLATSSKAKEKQSAHARSPTLSAARSPSPPVQTFKTPKRTVSVLVPSLPKDYLSPSPRKGTSTNKEGRSELSRTNSIHVSAAEASTSGLKRGRPSLSKPSTSTPPVKNKSKFKARNESETEYEDETSVVLDTPSTTTRGLPKRSAANKATSKLRDEIMPDVINFEKERKNAKRRRSSGLNDSFIPLRDEAEVEQERDGKKRRVEKAREEDSEAEVEEVISSSIPQTKSMSKPATTQGNGTKKRTEDEMSIDEDELSKRKGMKATQNKKGSHAPNVGTNQLCRLNKLGVKMTTKPNDCTHLVTKGIVRTEKFLCAIASSPFVLTEGWVNSSVRAGKLLPESDFLISDPEPERKWNFKLSTSLERAKREDGGEGLFKGMTFYVTPKVEIDLKLLKAVITSAGGQVQTSKPTARILKANDNRHVISCPADQSIWRPLVEEGFTIYSTELILLAVLTQEIRWKDDNCISSKPSL
ncbi:hypothetical protein DEU56DRAFT_740363 [Suillus clintonianus]|uniref:uncharacterized protein n=1 Tax=Suillus clintonianus TaxID=1904413 RepID=UPI001B86FA61|nr:uncharacterized protein DEU56DRAFT_740363 [Suillus clintonianus]KAG2130893.1 hypothetical protein DEU56DRAFT_740363 [Suillus clintonianus]